MKPKVVAFYTMGTEYADMAQKLIDSIKQFHLECDIWPIKNRGSWEENCQYKAEFMFEMCKRNQNKTILYIDVDAEIKQYPIFCDNFNGDIAVHYLDGKELLSGTIVMNCNPRTQELCRQWVATCKRDRLMWDQKALQMTLAKMDDFLSLKIVPLPPTYVQIFDTMAGVGQPVIEHYQASRSLKGKMNTDENPEPLINGVKLRRDDDGAFWIVRSNRDVEEYMDKHYIRLRNELKWVPKTTLITLEKFKNKHEDQKCYIIGKGKSLDELKIEDFEADCPIICLNESIKIIETLGIENPLYVVQQDARLRETCWPKSGVIFTSILCASWYVKHPERYTYDARTWGLLDNSLSVLIAMNIAKFMGCKNLVLYGFDSCMNGDLEYAKSIGYSASQGGELSRFTKHKALIEHQARHIDSTIEFKSPSHSLTSDNTEQL